jgi:pimeloyl-ACP methyl ester carboxylesterase
MQVDASEVLRACPVPILCLAGDADVVVRRRHVRRLLSILPSIQTCTLPAAHFVLLDAPEKAWVEISRFIHAHLTK